MSTKESSQSKAKTIIIVLLVVILAGLVFLVINNHFTPVTNDNTGTSETKQKPTINPIERNGSMRLEGNRGQNVFAEGEDIMLTLFADTAGKQVVGYDVALRINPDEFTFVGAESLVDTMKVIPNDENEGFALVTGILTEFGSDPVEFANEPVAELTFTASESGRLPITFAHEPGMTRDSNLVTLGSDDILGTVKDMNVYVGEVFSLNTGEEFALNDRGTTLTLTSVETPEEDCADCPITISADVVNGSLQESVTFQSGGLAGDIYPEQEVLDYLIEVHSVNGNTVEFAAAYLLSAETGANIE